MVPADPRQENVTKIEKPVDRAVALALIANSWQAGQFSFDRPESGINDTEQSVQHSERHAPDDPAANFEAG